METFQELNLIGQAPAFRQALDFVSRYATCDATVLVTGETGTGKELAARAIHSLGSRRDGPFVPINCGALQDTLVENELFGHAKGAFTDGRENTLGLIGDAEKGTLFLDEVEALSGKAQVALLRFLQDGTYRPLGSRQTVKANVRIVAASNRDLWEMAAQGEFRSDLIYRLQIGAVRMPSLRERIGDIRLLAQHFIRLYARRYRECEKKLDGASLRRLETHDWPGNVRELENVIHRGFIISDTPTIAIDDSHFARGPSPAGDLDACGLPFHIPYEVGFRHAKRLVIESFERDYVCWALAESQGNISQAARACDKERRTFGRLLKKYGIDKSEYLPGGEHPLSE
ncbi:sigma-54-dependent Fis family transcriptional regulator [Methylococcus sp. EFPC2]|uniref:sigma-54 interaction domain-containing protein n=1 Tax=Methylococcus sp. EFPC2 TaxID=2812648 RepID=UPI001967C038|nr:sigma-54 dependent transcriptional regulator [Methylococcus sp. EFPC2]QSA98411.1 sigma-54-dependent Fis family transcriptional regulator [Methylococcus sp. EFPC2]